MDKQCQAWKFFGQCQNTNTSFANLFWNTLYNSTWSLLHAVFCYVGQEVCKAQEAEVSPASACWQ
jgi:endonuclease III